MPTGASGSTRSSCPRAATSRCSASCRSSSAGDDRRCSDPLRDAIDLEPLRRGARRSRRRDRPARRPPGRRAAASRVADASSRTSSTRRSPRASPGSARQAGYNGLLQDVLKVRLRQVGVVHALGPAPADRGAAALRARATSSTSCALAGELQRRLVARDRLEWAREECRPDRQDSTDERDPDEVWRRLPRVTAGCGPRPGDGQELAALARAHRARPRTGPSARSCATRPLVEIIKRKPADRRELARSAA